MTTTQSVIENHLNAFLENKGIDAIIEDYDDKAVFISEDKLYRGKAEIKQFFKQFINALPEGALENFSLRKMTIDGNIAYITWSVRTGISLGTDTFYINDGKITSQTFAMYI